MKQPLFVLTFVAALGVASAASAAGSPSIERIDLLTRGPSDPALPAPNLDPQQIGVLAVYPIEPDVRKLASAGIRAEVSVELPSGESIVATARRFVPVQGFIVDDELDVVVDPVTPDDALRYHWYGVAAGTEIALTVHDGLLFGRVTSASQVNDFTFARDGKQPVMLVIDRDAIPIDVPDGPSIAPHVSVAAKPRQHSKMADTIDVLVLHTPNAVVAAGGPANLDALISASVANMSTALFNSEVVSVNINNVMPNGAQSLLVNYDEENNCFGEISCTEVLEFERHKRAMRTDLEVNQLRDQFAADLVVTFVGDSTSCGIAYTQRPDCGFSVGEPDACQVGTDYEAFAYSVVSAQPACADWNFAHEVGHQFGMEHDPSYGAKAGQASFLWSYGHKVSTVDVQARDVMAYANGCLFDCPVVLQYSNPQREFITFPGVASGTSVADAQGRSRFNALTASLLAEEMANFRGAAVTDRVFRGDFESLPTQ